MTGEAGRSARGWHQRLSNPRLPLWRESCTHLLSHVEGTGGTPPEGHVGAGGWSLLKGELCPKLPGTEGPGCGLAVCGQARPEKEPEPLEQKQSREGGGPPSRHRETAARKRDLREEEVTGLKTRDQGRPACQQPA